MLSERMGHGEGVEIGSQDGPSLMAMAGNRLGG